MKNKTTIFLQICFSKLSFKMIWLWLFFVFQETKALLEQEEHLLDKVDDVDSDLERMYKKHSLRPWT